MEDVELSQTLKSLTGTAIYIFTDYQTQWDGVLIDVKEDHLVFQNSENNLLYVNLDQILGISKNTKDLTIHPIHQRHIQKQRLAEVLDELQYSWITVNCLYNRSFSGVLSKVGKSFIILVCGEDQLILQISVILSFHKGDQALVTSKEQDKKEDQIDSRASKNEIGNLTAEEITETDTETSDPYMDEFPDKDKTTEPAAKSIMERSSESPTQFIEEGLDNLTDHETSIDKTEDILDEASNLTGEYSNERNSEMTEELLDLSETKDLTKNDSSLIETETMNLDMHEILEQPIMTDSKVENAFSVSAELEENQSSGERSNQIVNEASDDLLTAEYGDELKTNESQLELEKASLRNYLKSAWVSANKLPSEPDPLHSPDNTIKKTELNDLNTVKIWLSNSCPITSGKRKNRRKRRTKKTFKIKRMMGHSVLKFFINRTLPNLFRKSSASFIQFLIHGCTSY